MLKTSELKLTYARSRQDLKMEVVFSTYFPELPLYLVPKDHKYLFSLKKKKSKARTLYKTCTISENDKAAVSYADESEGQSGLSQQQPDTFLGLMFPLTPPIAQSTSNLIRKSTFVSHLH